MNDDELLEALRRAAAELDPPPASHAEAARAAFATRRLDEEIAELLGDSAASAPELVRSGSGEVRLLSFETAEVSVELHVRYGADRMSVRGLVSGASGEATIESGPARRSVGIDPEGWFTADELPPGPTRIRLRGRTGPVTTAWFLA